MDRARGRFDHVVRVQAEFERRATDEVPRSDRPLPELYADFHEIEHGEPASEPILEIFAAVEEAARR